MLISRARLNINGMRRGILSCWCWGLESSCGGVKRATGLSNVSDQKIRRRLSKVGSTLRRRMQRNQFGIESRAIKERSLRRLHGYHLRMQWREPGFGSFAMGGASIES